MSLKAEIVPFNVDHNVNAKNKKERMVDQRISNCSDCRRGIFPFHEFIWTNRGLVHTECSNENTIIST